MSTPWDEEQTGKLEALRADIHAAQDQVRRGDVVETTAEAFLSRTSDAISRGRLSPRQ